METVSNRDFFVDTSFLVALRNKSDQNHILAKQVFKELVQDKDSRFYFSDYILDEAYTLVQSRTNSLQICLDIKQFAQRVPRSAVLFMNEQRFTRTWVLFQKFFSRGLAFTDAFNIQLCQEFQIPAILTFDSHFKGVLQVLPNNY
ncbi:MAG: type II toxin-antitoxin system VapC family toxin [Candidatus Hodarchaeales archaeon]|jgi:predicted nucleic acid-binding protein